MNRRDFLQQSLVASSAAGMTLSFEEQALLAFQAGQASPPTAGKPRKLPFGKIGKVSISRLICGGNLISGFAHSRDLIYVSGLMTQYFTDAKVFETLALCEANGINTDPLDWLQGFGRRRDPPAGGISIRLSERRGFSLRGYV